MPTKSYQVKYHKDVLKFFVIHPDIELRFFEKLQILKYNPLDNRLDTKPLKWSKDKYRLRIGKYRFLYEIKEQKILIYFYDADSRGDVYK